MSAQPEDRPPTPDELAEMMQPGADWDRDGFHPTMARPFPSMQCTGVVKSGDKAGLRCSKKAVYGATVCMSHGAQLPTVRKRADALVESARMKLVGSLEDATDWLLDLAANSTSDAVRLKATTEVMDRSGLRGGVELDVSVAEVQDPGQLLRERLATLKRRTVEGELATDEAPSLPGTAIAGSSPTPQHRDNCHCGSNDPEEHRAFFERFNAAGDDTLTEDSPAARVDEPHEEST